MNNLNFTYPAIYYLDGDSIIVEVPDLHIGPFEVDVKDQDKLFDITWDKAAQTVQLMLFSGIEPPPSRTLEDLEVSPDNEKDAFLIELISK